MKKLSIAKKIFLSLTLAVSLLFINSATVFCLKSASAYTSYYGKNSITVTNGDFTDYNTNDNNLPYAVSNGWSTISNATQAYAGVIDTDSKTFNKKNSFTLPANPKTDESLSKADSKVLMIKSTENIGAKYGYKSDDITLSANKFYEVSVRVKTGLKDVNNNLIENTNSLASIYLSNFSNCFESINTNGNWKTYKFYISTDIYNSSTINLELRLGNKATASTGVVFFDNVQVLEIANEDYFNEENTISSQEKFINLNRAEITSLTNANFENNLTGFVVEKGNGNVSTPTTENISNLISLSNGGKTLTYGNTKSLFINNQTASATQVKTADTNTLLIKQHGYYYLTMLVKTGENNTKGLTITLDEKVSGSVEPITYSQEDIKSSTNDENNNFSLISFYIRGSSKIDSNVGLTFTLGTSEEKVTGFAIIDDIKLYQISESEYTSKLSNVLDLSKNITETPTITNGSFDFISSSNASTTYPLNPANWTSSTTNNTSGIIRVNQTLFSQDCVNYGLTSSQNPGPNKSYPLYVENNYVPSKATTKENVLMIKTTSKNDLYYTSSNFSLTQNNSTDSSKINKVEIGIKTLNFAKAFIKLVDENDSTLAILDNISNTDWTNYTIYIKNGFSAKSVRLVLGVKGDNNTNYAFFDFAKFTDSVTDEISSILTKENSCYVDLITDSFYSSSKEQIKSNIYKISNWSTYKIEEMDSSALYNGTINATTHSLATRKDCQDKNLLVISNTVKSYQILKSNYTFDITEGNYYEFSVWAKTEIDSTKNDENFGAYFELATVNSETSEISIDEDNKNKFLNITTLDADNNDWVKYSIYVYAESNQTIAILLGLGTEENPTIGKVYFDDVTASPITKESYVEKQADNTNLVSKVITVSSTSEEESNSTSSSTTSNPINIFVLFSSIILAVALVLAIAGYLIRRIPRKENKKIEKSEYIIKPEKINEQDVKLELKNFREAKLQELTIELDKLKLEKQVLQEEYQSKSNNEENLNLKEKIYAEYTKRINKLTKQIEYLESAITFNNDHYNIKNMEQIEIKKRKKESIEEFLKLKQDANKPKEEVKTEAKVKKGKSKRFNPNWIKKKKDNNK